MSRRKTVIILFSCLVLALIYWKRWKIDNSIYKFLVRQEVLKPCYKNSDFDKLFAAENIDYKVENSKVIKDSLKKFSLIKDKLESKLKIPAITHHVYFTEINRKAKLADFFVEKIRANIQRLNKYDVAWKHIIWTNNPEIFPEKISALENIEIRNIDEFNQHSLYKLINNAIENSSKNKAFLTKAADMTRLMVVDEMGGVYQDIDYEIYNANILFKLMHKFDFIGGREEEKEKSYYGNSFFAAKRKHPVLGYAIKKLIANNAINNRPIYKIYPCNLYDEIYFDGPLNLTLAYFAKNNFKKNKDIILPPWMIYNAQFARYKNKTCNLKKISENEFMEGELNIALKIKEFSTNVANNKKCIDDIYMGRNCIKNYPIMGADMFCGSWKDINIRNYYYWNIGNK